jgi:HEAT repeat protein
MAGRWWLGAGLIVVLASSFHAREASPAPLANFEAALTQLAKDLPDQSLPVAERLEIIRALAGWPTPEARPPLLAALKDPSPEIRGSAARALGWRGNNEAVAALRALAESSEEPVPVKADAIEALGAIGDPATRALLVAATRHPDGRMRQASLRSLAFGPLSDPAERVTYLMQLAEDGALEGLLRVDSLRELANVNEERVVDVFIRILENEPRFAMTLPETGGNVQQIMEVRRVQTRDVAAWAAVGLGELKAKRASSLLVRTAEDRSDFFLRLTSLRSLAVLSLSEGRPVFLRRLEDPVPEVRMAALAALAQLGDPTVVGAVTARLTDRHALVRTQAVRTLAVLGDATVRPLLEDLQKRELDSNVQYAIEETLTQLPR